MATHNELGKNGEILATNFLIENGYTILETNWVFQKAEIDILAQMGDTLAVIEVKTRSSIEFGLPQDFVNHKKIQLLVKAVNAYIETKNLELEVRFDIITVVPKSKENKDDAYDIIHLTDAFYHF